MTLNFCSITYRLVLKNRILVFLLVFIFVTSAVYAQKIASSRFYTSKGVLIADSSFKLSKNQLLKWRLVEDTLIKFISKTIEYPIMYLEVGMSPKVIFSFKVDKNGTPVEINFEKYGNNTSLLNPPNSSIRYIDTTIERQIKQLDGRLKPLHDSKQPNVRYYLPYKFQTFEIEVTDGQDLRSPTFEISDGWILFIHPRRHREEPPQKIYGPGRNNR